MTTTTTTTTTATTTTATATTATATSTATSISSSKSSMITVIRAFELEGLGFGCPGRPKTSGLEPEATSSSAPLRSSCPF